MVFFSFQGILDFLKDRNKKGSKGILTPPGAFILYLSGKSISSFDSISIIQKNAIR